MKPNRTYVGLAAISLSVPLWAFPMGVAEAHHHTGLAAGRPSIVLAKAGSVREVREAREAAQRAKAAQRAAEKAEAKRIRTREKEAAKQARVAEKAAAKQAKVDERAAKEAKKKARAEKQAKAASQLRPGEGDHHEEYLDLNGDEDRQ